VRTWDGLSAAVRAIAVTADGAFVFTASGGCVRKHEAASGKVFRGGARRGRARSIIARAQILITMGAPAADLRVETWAVAVSSDGQFVFSGGDEKIISQWAAPSGQVWLVACSRVMAVRARALGACAARACS
jgi:hypothetical protein